MILQDSSMTAGFFLDDDDYQTPKSLEGRKRICG
jgi:hypothetical protein